jgi:hypothetical protein
MHPLLRKLRVGDLRQKGRSETVVAAVLRKPALFGALVDGLREENPALRMRAADAIEKISRSRPDLLASRKRDFLASAATTTQKEVRWHLAQMLPRLPLTASERRRVFEQFISWLDDDSRIVKTFAMQGLVDLAVQDGRYRPRVLAIVRKLVTSGFPSVRSRAKMLLPRLRRLA